MMPVDAGRDGRGNPPVYLLPVNFVPTVSVSYLRLYQKVLFGISFLKFFITFLSKSAFIVFVAPNSKKQREGASQQP